MHIRNSGCGGKYGSYRIMLDQALDLERGNAPYLSLPLSGFGLGAVRVETTFDTSKQSRPEYCYHSHVSVRCCPSQCRVAKFIK